MDNAQAVSKWVDMKATTEELWSCGMRAVGVYSCQPYKEDRGSDEIHYYVFIDIAGDLSMITSSGNVDYCLRICKNIALFANCKKVV